MIVWRRQSPVLGWHLVRPVHAVGVEVRDRGPEKRLEGASIKRREGRRILPLEILLGSVLQVSDAGVVDGCVPIDLNARIYIPRPDLNLRCFRIKRHLDKLSDDRVLDKPTIVSPHPDAGAKHKLKLRFDDAAFELLFQREELRIDPYRLASRSFHYRPRLPRLVQVSLEFGSNLGSPFVVLKTDRLARFWPAGDTRLLAIFKAAVSADEAGSGHGRAELGLLFRALCRLKPGNQSGALNVGWHCLAQALNNQPDLISTRLLDHIQPDTWQALNLMFVYLEDAVVRKD